MSTTYKNINSDYYVNLNNGDGLMTVNGDLDVTGNITYVAELNVNDAFIVVAGNNTGTVTSMGLVAQKTANSWAGLRYNTTVEAWQISTSTSIAGVPVLSYSNIATGGGSAFVAGANTQVQFNNAGNFGATANLAFDSALNKLTLNGYQSLGNIGTAPTQTANAVSIYTNGVDVGNTGVYIVGTNGANTVTSSGELINATRARLYSIIF
jgi:hypothetical protein